MSIAPLYPLRFQPILRRLIWGGRRLGTVLHKPIGNEEDYAESWELSDYHDSVSVVCEGSLAGTTLRQLVRTRGQELLGSAVVAHDQFPLLVKFIDAHQNLSVQVHPNDEKGRRLAGDNGKTETWVIIDAEPGSLIYAGLKPGVGEAELTEAIQTKAVENLLHRFEPKHGDSILIEAGTVHAIGAGVLLTEIQEMSDATFRIDDWGRLGDDGSPVRFIFRNRWSRLISAGVRSTRSDPRLSRSMAAGRASGDKVAVFRPQAAQAQAGDVGGTGRSVHDPHGSVRVPLTSSIRGEPYVSISVRQSCSRPLPGPCQVSPRGDATVLTCVVP